MLVYNSRARKIVFFYCMCLALVYCFDSLNNSLHVARKYTRIFVRGHYLFLEANSFPRELRGTDNVQGQISEHIFAPNEGYCVYYPSNLFRNARSFENWGIFLDIPQF